MQTLKLKPVVRYIPTDRDHIQPNEPAFVHYVLNHPSPRVSNAPFSPVQTSRVIEVSILGDKITRFETENTVYLPIEDEDQNNRK